ncbi:MAG: DUF5666 domain-containing protein [Nitrospinota bacterium]
MLIKRFLVFLLYASSLLLLLSCGTEMGEQIAAGGIIGTGEKENESTLDPEGLPELIQNSKIVSIGTITALDGITVNGVRYETKDATVFLDGREVQNSVDSLDLGMVVEVHGLVNAERTAGIAEKVKYDNIVEGPLTEINTTNQTFVILGKTIKATTSTIFELFPSGEQGNFSNLLHNKVYEISGFSDSDGSVIATRVEEKEIGGVIGRTGVVTLLASDDTTFTIDTVLVNYSDALLKDFAEDTISNGDLVEVKGTMSDADPPTFLATKVKLKNQKPKDIAEEDDVEIEGIINSMDGPVFELLSGGVKIDVTFGNFTKYEHVSRQELRAGMKVEVEGIIVNGNLEANEIERKRRHDHHENGGHKKDDHR